MIKIEILFKEPYRLLKVWSENVVVHLDYKPAIDVLSTMYRRILRGRIEEVVRFLE